MWTGGLFHIKVGALADIFPEAGLICTDLEGSKFQDQIAISTLHRLLNFIKNLADNIPS